MKVLLATPAHDGRVTDIYLTSVIKFIASANANGVEVTVLTLSGESLITRARNNILATFLAGEWTELLFVDGDIGFEPENAWRLLGSQYPISATAYPLKTIDWELASLGKNADESRRLSVSTVVNYLDHAPVSDDGFAPVLDAGTGFMRIHKQALLQMVERHPEKRYTAEDGTERWALFDTALENGRYLSEDYAFCRIWQRMGGQVMVDTQAPPLHHRGLYEYGE